MNRWYYELKLIGSRAILVPLLVTIGFGLIGFLLHLSHLDTQRLARVMVGGEEMLFPIAAGCLVGTIVAQDPALELQLTFPRRYLLTALRRFAFLVVWTFCAMLVYSVCLTTFQSFYLPAYMLHWFWLLQFWFLQILWLVPFCFCVAVGFCFSLLLQSRVAGVAVLSSLWIAEVVFKDLLFANFPQFLLFPVTLSLYPATNVTANEYARYVSTPHLVFAAVSLVLFLAGYVLLRNPEHMLKGVSEE
jgi:hypothetical protein